ncbi:hypothetical protein IWX81_001400 [Salinibacterium sp. CAN_S4]|uniref:GH12 family glycosyl hydrolase domain-containing protein n=1 Tax=Salinibacterium sp. CAN_S4 TaxID=2787727 RepID=UPI0018F043C2
MTRKWLGIAVATLLVGAALAAAPPASVPSAEAAPVLCDQFGAAPVAGGKYIVQNNRWGASTAQCIDVRGNGFAITRAEHNNATNGPPASYPSIFAGCHYTQCTTNSGLPLKVSDFADPRATYKIATPNSGEWNASFDLWFDPTKRTDGQNTGAELMIWANHRGAPRPIGQPVATKTINGAVWDVWVGNIGWNVVSYVRQQPTNDMTNFSVKAFVDDAVTRGQIDRSWYMTSVQAGFEPWVGGTGLAVTDFAFAAGGSGTGGGTGGSAPCTARYKVTNTWNGGFTADVTVTNSGSSASTGWSASWSLASGQSVANVWNASYSVSGAKVSAKNVSYNGALSAGASTTFGFQGTGSTTAAGAAPTCTTTK